MWHEHVLRAIGYLTATVVLGVVIYAWFERSGVNDRFAESVRTTYYEVRLTSGN